MCLDILPGIEDVAHGVVVGTDLGVDLLVQMMATTSATMMEVVARDTAPSPLTNAATLLARSYNMKNRYLQWVIRIIL
jgi:hypothetical protein